MIYESVEDTKKNSNQIQSMIDMWEETYGNNKSAAINSLLDTIKVEFCDNDHLIESEARHLFKQIMRSSIFKGDMNGCKQPIQKCRLSYDGCKRREAFNIMLDGMEEEYDVLSRSESMKSNLQRLDEGYGIQEMFNKQKAFNSDTYSKHAIDKLCHLVNETYKGKLDKNKVITICMEMSKVIFDSKPGVISEQDILSNVTSFFLISEDTEIGDIEDALDDVKLYNPKDINIVVESLVSMNQLMTINESEELDFESKSFKTMVMRRSYKIRSVFEDIVKLSKEVGKKNRNQERRMIDRITKTLYGTPTKTIIDGAPDLIGITRRVISYGVAMSVNPVFVIPVIIVDALIEGNVDLKEVPKVIKVLETEKAIAQDSLNDIRIDIHPDNKPELRRHIEELDNQIDKLKTYMQMHDLGYYLNEDYHNENYNENIGMVLAIHEAMFVSEDIILTENVVKNSMRKAKEKLRTTTETLSAKEKAASRKLDDGIERFTNGFEKALSLENREKVIKGSVLPDASKVIKLAVATGAAWAIAPAVALVGALGSWAISKNVRDRERQLVLDEIGVHLRIVEKKIQQADMNNDIDAVEELMKLEGKLQREEQRIRYRQKAYR